MVVAAFDSREIGNKGLSVKATEGQPGLLSSQCTSKRSMNQNYCPDRCLDIRFTQEMDEHYFFFASWCYTLTGYNVRDAPFIWRAGSM